MPATKPPRAGKRSLQEPHTPFPFVFALVGLPSISVQAGRAKRPEAKEPEASQAVSQQCILTR